MIKALTRDEIKQKSIVTKEEWREYTKTVWQIPNVSHPEHPAVFPVELPHRLIKLFSFWGDRVLDPFSGTGTTAIAALPLGRDVTLVEQNVSYAHIAVQRIAELPESYGNVEAVVGDNRDLSWISNDSVGLVVTSPPYWNKADYGSNESNLGNVEGYMQFVESLSSTFEECYRVLMPGRKICVVTANVSQHTDSGLLCFPLAADLTMLLRRLGFVMVNEVIWNKNGTGGRWGSWGTQRPIFGSYPYPPNFLFKTVHEYILVFAKPPASPTKGPKVKPLNELMRLPESNGHGRV